VASGRGGYGPGVANHGDRSRWLLQRLDLIAQRRERRRQAEEEQRSGHEPHRVESGERDDDRT
jgi:hypothetical protein